MDKTDFTWKKPIAISVIGFIIFLFGFGWGYKVGVKVTPPEKDYEIDNPFAEDSKIDNPFEEVTPTPGKRKNPFKK